MTPVQTSPFQMTEDQVRHFRDQGFFILPNGLNPAEVEELRTETAGICFGRRGEVPGAETLAPGADEVEAQRRILCIHFPHKLSPVMLKAMSHPSIVEVLTKVISPNVKSMQSMLFIKASGKPGQAWHQDEYDIPTRDRTLTGAWIALDKATVENGCLWAIPGSHKQGLLWPQRWHADKRFDCAGEAYQFPYEDKDAVPLEVEAGTIIFFNGYLLHRSLPNRAASGFRRCLVNHYMSAESLLPWYNTEGESFATADYRDILMVAGKDPYAYKGTVDVAKPHVRPSGEGGCGNSQYNDGKEVQE